MDLYELTDLFHHCYSYHNTTPMDYAQDYAGQLGKNEGTSTSPKSLSRFQLLRRFEACSLGSRPFFGGSGISPTLPNTSLGYYKLLMNYVSLPYKSVLSETGLIKVNFDKRLYTATKIDDEEELEDIRLETRNNPLVMSDAELSDDVSDVYYELVRKSNKLRNGLDQLPTRVTQDGLMGFIHSDVDWVPEHVQAIDLITEPFASWDPTEWSCFFVLKTMSPRAIMSLIKNPGKFWNKKALEWALENSMDGGSLISGSSHYNYNNTYNRDPLCGENFSVKSFYNEKGDYRNMTNSYYGKMLVVDAHYINEDGKIDRVIFFPSTDYAGVGMEGRYSSKDISKADVLFKRKNIFDTMREAITIIPFDRSEPSIERQRAYGHEVFNPVELIMRLDTYILNFSTLMSVPFYKDRNQGTTSAALADLEIAVGGYMQDIGSRDFIEIPFKGDLESLLNVRAMLLQHAMSKAFLGGLDGAENAGSGTGYSLANMRLLKDGRIHKHNLSWFVEGLTELFSKMFRKILDLKDSKLVEDDLLLNRLFYDRLFKVYKYDPELFEFSKKDVVSDTCLPYWINVVATMSGGSYYGAAELVAYSEIKQIFGDSLGQRENQSLTRSALKSVLGSQDALDILGDPRENIVDDEFQVYRAQDENATLIGSVNAGVLSYEDINSLAMQDDHVLHLSKIHNPKAVEILERLRAGEVSPQELQTLSDDVLDTRVDLTLQLGALAGHISSHLQNLGRAGRRRPEINRLREETNQIIQASEGMLNSLEITLRALKAKREAMELRLANISPENELEREKLELKRLELAQKDRIDTGKLELANRLAADKRAEHVDKQYSKARDRQAEVGLKTKEQAIKREELLYNKRKETKE